jgi:sec-independent protein translocase protein TatC
MNAFDGAEGESPMPQEDEKQQPQDPKDLGGDHSPLEADDPSDPELDGRIPDAHQPYLFDEDGNPDYSSYDPGSLMVEPGDTPPNDPGVQPVDPYQVEPHPDEDPPYSYDYYEDEYSSQSEKSVASTTSESSTPVAATGSGSPPGGKSSDEDEDEEEEGMLRMSFMGHLEELRSRLIKIVAGLLLAFVASIGFSPTLWDIVQQPAEAALTELGVNPPSLTQIKPMEAFNVVYIKLPLISALFLASPWILWQIWAFIAPGLYKRERKWAGPFVIVSAGLFITGGLFAYFIAFRFGLTFLLGIGRDINITPMVSISEYFDLFMNVVLAIAVVFELPVLIFFLTLLRVVNPGFLVRNSRYAILGIVVLAAVITPTPDVFNLVIFSVPMIVLFFIGVLFSYILVLHQENRKFPWKVLYWTLAGIALIIAGLVAIAMVYHGYKWQWTWPFLVQ